MRFYISYRLFFSMVGLLVLLILIPGEAWSQCPMCRIGAETNLAGGGTAGAGLNKGIIFLLSLPYVIVATFAYIWWKSKRKPIDEN